MIKRNLPWILLALFLLWAAFSPDPAAKLVKAIFGWFFLKFLPGLGEFAGNLAS